MTSGRRTILHVDMDAFYVSVELLRRPELVGRPVVVGGAGARGVVAAANYEARRYGVFSAMSSAKARRLCPQAVFLPGDHEHYADVSREVHRIFDEFTPLVEPIALDEAFLDVTGSRHLFGDGAAIGQRIREQVFDELGLRCAVGVATTKFIAKLASKRAKPRVGPEGITPGPGVLEVEPGTEIDFLHPLPVAALWGVGPATLTKLERLGVGTVGDLARLGVEVLEAAVGRSHGRHLHDLSLGRDDRPVVPDRGMKSVGHEETFAEDLTDRSAIRAEVVRLADAVSTRLRAHGVSARTIQLKIRFSNFVTITRSTTPGSSLATGPAIVAAIDPLLERIDPGPGIRLIGVSGSGLVEPVEQLTLLDVAPSRHPNGGALSDGRPVGQESKAGVVSSADVERVWAPASDALDEIREKFGPDAIGPASTVRRRRPGGSPWG